MCEPRQVCTLPTFFGFVMSVMSKMRMPRSRSLLTVLHALRAAVEARAQILARDEEQVIVDGHVALRRRAVEARADRRRGGVRDVPDLVAVVVALDGVVACEREVGVGSADELLGRSATSTGGACSRQPRRSRPASPTRGRGPLRPMRGSGLGAPERRRRAGRGDGSLRAGADRRERGDGECSDAHPRRGSAVDCLGTAMIDVIRSSWRSEVHGTNLLVRRVIARPFRA